MKSKLTAHQSDVFVMPSQGARKKDFIDGEADINLREFSFQDSPSFLGLVTRLRICVSATAANHIGLTVANAGRTAPNWQASPHLS